MYDHDEDEEDIVIERVPAIPKEKPKSSSGKKSTSKSKTKKNSKKKATTKGHADSKYALHVKLTGLLLALINIFILLSLVSYTRSDQMNLNFSFSDFFGLFSEDGLIQAKADMTKNWLGLLGAKIADFAYNSLFGFISIVGILPLMLIARDLIIDSWIREKTLHRLVSFIVLAFVFSLSMGAWNLAFPTMGTEWSGAIGYFSAKAISNLIGTAGIIIVSNLGLLALILMSFDIDWNRLLNRGTKVTEQVLVNSSETLKAKSSSFLGNLKDKITSRKDDAEDPESLIEDNAETDDKDASIESQEESSEKQAEVEKEIKIKSTPAYIQNQDTDESANTDSQKKWDSNAALRKLFEDDEVIENAHHPESKDSEIEHSENVINEDNELVSPSPIISREPESEDIDGLATELESFLSDLPAIEVQREAASESQTPIQESSPSKDPLRVRVVEKEAPEYDEPISTAIHDRELNYKMPGLELLNKDVGINRVDDEELKMNARILEEKLETFKITIKNLEVTPGPVVTQYEFVPGDGIKVSRIEGLSDDLAMALKARGIRIIAPIPGKGTVGVEIPNNNPSLVTFSSVIATKAFKECNFNLPVVLGKDISGDIYIIDLAKMPHLLIAGATGAGKSVGVNALIASLLYKKHPSELKFVIVDPKKVEMSQYAALKNHYMAASPDVRDVIITDSEDAKMILNSTVEEMENRYTILANVGQRNILDYNKKVREGKYKDRNDKMVHREMPYIVVIIDELADLMMTAGKDIESPIVRLAQKARAVGIHLVLATQRPSVDVITGLIKANFPARISYLVASKIDSRTILDGPGADKLLGNGDMLVLPAGRPKPDRVQNSYISTDEIENICEHIGSQHGYSMPYMLPSVAEQREGVEGIDPSDRDPLFMEAAQVVISAGKASTSMFQRQMRIGYARAGRMMDELEAAGVVGPPNGSKPRDVLISSVSEIM